jgi:site-specific DNA-methyltransferase (adenine-specific)
MKDFEALRQILVWNKDSMVLGHSDYHYKHEPILYGWKPGAPHYFTNDRTQTTVMDYKRPKASIEHPTMKPIELWAKFLTNSSLEDAVVYDPYLGSGTSMVASHQLNRKCYGMELDPKYCQVIIDRMKKLDPDIIIKRNNEIQKN